MPELKSNGHTPSNMAPSHLCVLFLTTGGQNAENLGSDEEQVVSFVYQLFDVSNNKVVTLQQHYVRPRQDDISEHVLTEECKAQTSLPEESIKNAQPLETILEEFEKFLSIKEFHPDHGSRPACLITDGPLHLRMVLHPEAVKKNLQLENYFYRYFDLRKEFTKFYKKEFIHCIKDMLDFLNLECDQSVEYGVRQCQEMASIITRLINDGYQFEEPEIIRDKLEPGICTKGDYVDDETVIRARGLPWQSSDADIAKFFQGLNVAKGGVALCLSQQGRRNGEALIRFESKEHRDLALRKHKHHLGQRYIEVYRATGKDFVNVAGGNNTEAQAFLSRHSGQGGQVIVRMRGLPYTCTAQQVLDFFRSGDKPTEVLDGEEGILFVHQADGRATGDAFVLFSTDEDANKALSRHRECIGSRYIELFKSTTAEVQQVLNRSMDPRNPSDAEPQLPPLIQQLPHTSSLMFPQQIITSGTMRDCIRLRGLPFEASVTDILTFLGEHSRNIIYQGVHMVYNAQGTPSGEAFIQMDSEQSADAAALNKHKKFMFIANKKRYIEVIQCSGEDMNLVLTNGVPNGGLPPQAAVLPSPSTPMAMQRPLISPGGSMFSPPTTFAIPNGLSLTQPMQAHSHHPMIAAQAQMGTTAAIPSPITSSHLPHHLAASMGMTAAGMSGMSGMAGMSGMSGISPMQTLSGMSGMTSLSGMTALQGGPRISPYSPYHQPILYWYPSPPVSPQSAYYVQAAPATIIMKGLGMNTSLPEIMAFFDGIYEQVPPDIQVQRGPDGRMNGEAVVTFASRVEAERAINERNRKIMGNRYIELHLAA